MKEKDKLGAVLIPLRRLFTCDDRYDERFIIDSFRVICAKSDEYFAFAEEFPYLPTEFSFFFKRVFGDTKTLRRELCEAEKVYKAHIERSRVDVEHLRESVFKSLLTATQTNTTFRFQFDILIVRPVVNLRMRAQNKLSINASLYAILDDLYVFFYPYDLFVEDIKRIY